ncbi:CCA tRNA nucleotidyltransferase [Humidisolicoccus flavus]|uniref:CCA tRNA nucleotidyltransferase n=1 Tax=Humidisolicoccus flavus TaxID=3111414 RepID=UPI0032491B3E
MVSVAVALERLERLASSEPTASLAAAFERAGFELALVGGPVRDAFLGRTTNDLDYATNALPQDILKIVSPIAAATWDVGRAFGTIAATVHGETVEITTYRSDVYDGETRKPEVEFSDTLEADLIRRDFTINAMALRLPSVQLVDISGGVEDLLENRLNTPQVPQVSFRDDPLRMLRAARFVAQLGVEVSPAVEEAMRECAPSIANISAERVRDELSKLLCGDAPSPGLRLLTDTGLLSIVLPEIPALRLERDEHAHHKDVYEHTLTVLDQTIALEKSRHPDSPPDLIQRLAAIMHDVGKPPTKRIESGNVVSFHNHDIVGARMTSKRLKALRFDNDTVKQVSRLVELHLRFYGYTDAQWSDSAVRRYVRDAGAQLERLHILTRSDVTTRNRRKAQILDFAYDDLEERISVLAAAEELDAIRPDLDGAQIMKILDVPPGPVVGQAYKMLLEARLDEGALGEEEATRRLKDWWSSRSNEHDAGPARPSK